VADTTNAARDARSVRDDAETASRLNAETICGMQAARGELETRVERLTKALTDLLKQLDDDEADREEVCIFDYGCPICTHRARSVSVCARHRAQTLLRELSK
jgi:predicted ArsR family transcriptional regulator